MTDSEKLQLITQYRDKVMNRFIEDPSLDFVSGVLDGYITELPVYLKVVS